TGDDPANNMAIVDSDASALGLWIGYWGQASSMNVENGANLNITNQSTIGQGGEAVVTQNGGIFTSNGVRIGGGNDATINLNGGQMTARTNGFVVGDAGGGTVTMTQTGGTLTTNGFAVGKAGSTGIYNMTGGTLNGVQYGGNFQIGAIGSGSGSVQSEFNLGDAAGTGTIQMANTASLLIDSRNSMLRGWGTFDLGGVQSSDYAARLYNDGVVKADGYGIDRDLDLSQFNHVEIYNTINTGTNGWFAVNCGRLLLPSIAVAAGNGSYNWGDDSYFTTTSLVNSFRVTFTGASAGNLTAALLAEDRSDVAAHDGLAFLAVWQMDQLAFANANIAFRFDDAKAAELGIDESLLNVYKLVNGAWEVLPGTVDSLSNIISISTDSLGTFAVGVPEPTTLIILGIGAALLRKRSR
ncbi:MAG: PEP-CTERM sorting domain-containing protein, partial [Planctomycetaceae bacterium]|nr:PEP-CTERM sorting domain-containing protein [Planctomycetaceae bacterium]